MEELYDSAVCGSCDNKVMLKIGDSRVRTKHIYTLENLSKVLDNIGKFKHTDVIFDTKFEDIDWDIEPYKIHQDIDFIYKYYNILDKYHCVMLPILDCLPYYKGGKYAKIVMDALEAKLLWFMVIEK